MPEFCHLHVHTEYSLLDGANRIEPLVLKAKEDGSGAIAMTDHGNMFGALEFYNTCKKHEIKPIIGCEVYITRDRHKKHSKTNPYNHLTLLAADNEGLANLYKLTSISYVDGLSYRPRIDMEVLSRHARGIICLSGCLAGRINELLLDGRDREALHMAGEYRDLFGADRFYVELQRNGLRIQDQANEGLVDIANKMSQPLVATNDIHYLRGEDCTLQDTLLCVATGSKKSDSDRFRFETETLFTKTPEEMSKLFGDHPDAIRSTLDIASDVELNIDQGNFVFPRDPGQVDTRSDDEILQELVDDGLKERYGDDGARAGSEPRRRADHELSVISSMGFSAYFIAVQGITSWARSKSIQVGPGRGSAAGSIVSYALGITAVDPLRHGLIFERFLNSSRDGLPDIDIDFSREDRTAVIEHLKDKYGDDRVAHIATYGRFGPKAAIRQIAKVLEVPLKDADIISKKLTADTLTESVKLDPSLNPFVGQYPELFDMAKRVEGMVQYSGTHASGVVVGDRPLYEIVPLARNPKDGSIITQWDLEGCEKVGLVKFDLLGLDTLTVLKKTLDLVEESTGTRVNLLDLTSFDDPEVYKLLAAGDTEGVFQCYSDGMRRLLVDLVPDRFEHIVAALALFRPGPLESGIAKQFINRRHGREPVKYIHVAAEECLRDTYGTMVYQEQIMELAVRLAGFTLDRADSLRKAVGKKIPEMLASFKEAFLQGCSDEGKLDDNQSAGLWEDIVKFGRYGFNLSHSASYAYLTYWTAWLKKEYPKEFYCANLDNETDQPDRFLAFVRDVERHGLKIQPPQLFSSEWGFTAGDDDSIRMGISGVKGIGPAFIEQMEKEGTVWEGISDPTTLIEAMTRLPNECIRKNLFETLASSGMLDSFGVNRGRLYNGAKRACDLTRKIIKAREAGTASRLQVTNVDWSEFDEWTEAELLAGEHRSLGFYLSGHPMAPYKPALYSSTALPISNIILSDRNLRKAKTVGFITSVEIKTVKSGKNKGKKYARLIVEDDRDYVVCTMFTHSYDKYFENVTKAVDNNLPVRVLGNVDTSSERPQIIVASVKIWDATRIDPDNIFIDLPDGKEDNVPKIAEISDKHPGPMNVNIFIRTSRLGVVYKVRSGHKVEPSEEFIKEVEDAIYG